MSLCCMAKEFVLVIDPGHGGHDYGAVGDKTNEKTINLAVAKKFGKLIENNLKDVKVVYTRSNDTFISLKDRANIANRAKGDLFISIHVNSVDKKSKNRRTVSGSEVYTLGLHKSEENLAVAKRENSVIALESDYTETYKGFDPNSIESYIIFELSQSKNLDQSIEFAALAEKELTSTAHRADKGVKQAGFWVLWATGMPAVLVELDFICNPVSESFMASDKGQEQLAKALFNAFKSYRGYETDNDAVSADSKKTDEKPLKSNTGQQTAESGSSQTTSQSDEIEYRVQILANDRQLPLTSSEFKGVSPVEEYFDKGLYKYTVGHALTLNDAKKILGEMKKKFPEAFIIRMKGGKRIY